MSNTSSPQSIKWKRGAFIVATLLILVIGAGLAAPFVWLRYGYEEELRRAEAHFPLVQVFYRNRLSGERVFRIYDEDERLLFRSREGKEYEIIEEFFGEDGELFDTVRRARGGGPGQRRQVFYGNSGGPNFIKIRGRFVILNESEQRVFSREYDQSSLKAVPHGSILPRSRYEGAESEHGREGVWTFWDAQGRVEFQYLYEKGKRKDARIGPPWWNDVEDKKLDGPTAKDEGRP